MGAYEKSTDVNQIAAVYEKYRENPETAYLGCSMGIIYRDPEDSYYDDAKFAIVKGNTVLGNLMDDVRFYGELALVREGIEKIHEALPDYKYVPMRDVREAMYPEKMTTERLAEALDEIAEAFDPYEYRDNVDLGENTVQEVMLDLQSGNTHSYISYLKDIVEEECDLSVRAGVLIERLKSYEPELPKDMEPMVYVNYCEKSELGNPRCQKLSDLDSKTVEQDKAWYADRDPNTNEPKTTAQMFFTVYYAEKGDKMLHHFQGKIDCSELLYRVNLSIDDSKKVSFVVPSVHQCRWDKFKRFCFNFIFPCIENGTINEIIVNDIGTLLFIRTEGPKNVRISLGRSWDKTTRECRFNIYDLIDFKNNQSMIEKPSLAGAFYLDFYKKYIIAGAEIDTPPDINLSIPKINGFTWNVIYPKIVVSRSSFCELGSFATKETPFVLNNCGKTCQKYYKQSHIIEARELMKIENTICYEQKRIPNDFIDGEYRLVYSEIF